MPKISAKFKGDYPQWKRQMPLGYVKCRWDSWKFATIDAVASLSHLCRAAVHCAGFVSDNWSSLQLVMASDGWYVGSNAPSISSPGVDKDRMRPGHRLSHCVVFSLVLSHCSPTEKLRHCQSFSSITSGEQKQAGTV